MIHLKILRNLSLKKTNPSELGEVPVNLKDLQTFAIKRMVMALHV